MNDIELKAKKIYQDILINEKNSFAAIGTVKTLVKLIDSDESATLTELSKKIEKIIKTLKSIEPLTEVDSITEIFYRFTSLKASEFVENIQEAKKTLKERGNSFLEKVVHCEQSVAKHAHPFISDGCSILTHSYSRLLVTTLSEALKGHKRFSVYVTQSCPDKSGEEMQKVLTEMGIPCKLIFDTAIGYYMEQVDMVIVDSEGVVENGGLINKIGTYPLALCAKALNKPFYVLAQSYKFLRLYPLNQEDIPDRIKYKIYKKNTNNHPLVDYTPPTYVSLLLTDIGILTTAAVSDVLIHLYL